MLKIIAGCIACVLSLLPAPTQAQELETDQILANHVAALGGAEAIESIENIHVRLQIFEPGFVLKGDYRATRDGRVRIDVYEGGTRVFSEGIDGKGGWQQSGEGSGVLVMSPAGKKAMQNGIEHNLYGLYRVAERSHQIELIGRSLHQGVNYYRLRLIMADKFERHYFINPDTWLIDFTRETSALHPDLDPNEQAVESMYTDYTDYCGVLRSAITRTIELKQRTEIQRSELESVSCNQQTQELKLDRPEMGA